jgi:hypothetical protein
VKTLPNEISIQLNVIIERTSAIVDIGRMPTSCVDLHQMGNKLSGFFSIMEENKIQTVHCNFKKQNTDGS